MPTPEEHKTLIRRFFRELMSGGDLSFVDRYVAREFEYSSPTYPEPHRGPHQFRDHVAKLRGACPDLQFTLEHLVAQGDAVLAHWTCRGAHTGAPLRTVRGEVPAQGRPFVIDGMSWFRFAGGKFVEVRVNEDTLGLLQQIGALPSPPAPPATTPEQNLDLAGRYFHELMNQGRLEIIPEIMTPNITFRICTLPDAIRGHDGLRGFVAGLRTGFPDLRFTIDRQMAEGDKVGVRWFIDGAHKGVFLAMPPTGNKIHDQGIDLFIISGGKISEIWVNENDLGLMKQLGAL